MTYELKDRVSLKVMFNDVEFPFSRVNSLGFVHMSSSSRIAIPMLHMKLQDNTNALSDGKELGEGTKIQIVIAAANADKSDTYTFRMNTMRREAHAGGMNYEFDGYLDVPVWWHGSRTQGITGTSSAAIRQIAADVGLNFVGDETTDAQLWLPKNLRFHEWARRISERGYRSDSSCMQLGVALNGDLRYKDVSVFDRVDGSFNYGGYKSEHFVAGDAQPNTSSGTMNHFSGYNDLLVAQNVTTDAQHAQVSDLDINKDRLETGSLQMNANIKKSVEQGMVRFSPIDIGNLHEKYEQALYQNRRGNNMFSAGIDLVTSQRTGLNLFDVAHLTYDQPNSYQKALSGAYRIVAKTIRVQGADYAEKFQMVRRTMNVFQDSSIG